MTVECPDCGEDLNEADGMEGSVNLFEMGSQRADLEAVCPACHNVLEMEASIIAVYD